MTDHAVLLDAALDYIERGWPVFALAAGTKIPREGTNGVLDATTDPDTIRRWWSEMPNANIGIALGEQAGVIVIDVDRDPAKGKHGDDDLADAEHTYGPLPRTPTSLTPSGGSHLVFRHPGRPITVRSIGHLDIQRDGLYIVAPPSVTKAGEYAWDLDLHVDTTPIVDLPPAWIEMLTKVETKQERPPRTTSSNGSPLDDYNARTDFVRLLEDDGAYVGPLLNGRPRTNQPGGPYRPVTRPGKSPREGPSARLWLGNVDVLKVFTSSWSHLPVDVAVSAAGYYAHTRHHGDLAEATRTLRREGYGRTDDLDPDELRMTPAAPDTDAAGDDEADPWPDPLPLSEAPDLPPFPLHALPSWVAEYARVVAEDIQVPADLPATLALAALSVLASGGAEMLVRDTWREPLNLYLVVAMPPGAGKSPAFKAMMRPVEAFELERAEQAAHAIASAEQNRRVTERLMKRAEDAGHLAEAQRLLTELHLIDVPATPKLIMDDATPEALTKGLAEQKGRIALLSTEGGVFELMTGRYSERSHLDPYLMAWSGDTIRVDRIGRPGVTIHRPALTIGITVQPTVIERLSAYPELAGRGLTARFMYAIPPDLVGRRDLQRMADADPALRSTYDRRILEIARAMASYDSPGTLTFDPDARAMFLAWRQSLEDRRTPSGDLRPMAEWSTKLESSVARVAGLLHLADGGRAHGSIGADVMQRALVIGAYWIDHAFAAHDLWGASEEIARARKVVEWIEQNRLEQFTVRECHRAMQSRFTRVAEVSATLELLIERGWVRALDGKTAGRGAGTRGHASPRFAVNPALTTTEIQGSVRTVHSVPRDKNQSYLLTSYARENGTPLRQNGQNGQIPSVDNQSGEGVPNIEAEPAATPAPPPEPDPGPVEQPEHLRWLL